MLSLACGSAQGVIEIMAEYKSRGIVVETLLVDLDQTALDYAQRMAEKYGVEDRIKTVKTNVLRAGKIVRDNEPDIVEMVGLLDYLPQRTASELIKKIYASMTKGVLLVANINYNIERSFVQHVVNWRMIYRDPCELLELVNGAQFDEIRLVYQPLMIHGVLIACKNETS